MRRTTIIIPLIALAAAAVGQTQPTEPPPPKNIDRTLDTPITIDAENIGFNEFIARLRKLTDTNITVNWNALTQTGLTRDTPITLHLKDVPYETVVQTLMEILPGQKSRPNYFVDGNVLAITTNAELGKGPVPRLYPLDRVVAYSLGDAAGAPTLDHAAHATLLENVLRAELTRAGEPIDAAGSSTGHAIAIRGGTMAASLSDRGQFVLVRAFTMLNAPIRPGQYAPGTAVTAAAKHALDALASAAGGKITDATYLAIAKEPEKYRGTLNVALLPGTSDELARTAPALGGTVSDGGIVLIGPKKILAARTLFAAYDIREVIKHTIAASTQKPPPSAAEGQALVMKGIKKKITPLDEWGGTADIGKRASLLIGYEGVLIVFATTDEQRAVTAALAEMNH